MHTVVQKRQKGSTDLDHRHFYYFFSLRHFKHWVTASSWLPLVLEVTKSESFTHIYCQLKEESHRKFEIQPSTKSTRSCKLMWTCKTSFQLKKGGVEGGGETQGRETKGGKERFKENGTVLCLSICELSSSRMKITNILHLPTTNKMFEVMSINRKSKSDGVKR